MDNIQKNVINGPGAELLVPGDRVLVALSGGPDSVFLLRVLLELKKIAVHDLEIIAAHLNHCLRSKESDRDEAFVKDFCAERGVTIVTERVNVNEMPGSSVEEKARNARYDFLRRTAEAQRCSKVATGHTRDDLAETVLFRIMRGTGINGLAAMEPCRPLAPDSDILLIRPLLEISRNEVMQSLDAGKAVYVNDSSNADVAYTRNRIRTRLLPLLKKEFNPNVTSALAALAHSSRECRAGGSDALSRIASGVLIRRGISCEQMAGLSTRELQKLLNRAIADLSGSAVTLSRDKVLEARRLIRAGTGPDCVELGRSVVLRRSGGTLFAQRTASCAVDEPEPLDMALPGYADIPGWGRVWAESRERKGFDLAMFRKFKGKMEAAFDGQRLGSKISFRAAQPDEMIRPLGMNGKRKRVRTILREAGLAILAGKGVVCAASDDTIIWIPGLVTGHEVRVREDTQTVYVFRVCLANSSG